MDVEHKEYAFIWLEPACAENGYEGRQWCQDNVWGEKCSDCDAVPVKFIRADIVEDLKDAILKIREIALACCRASDVDRINEIAKGAFAAERGG